VCAGDDSVVGSYMRSAQGVVKLEGATGRVPARVVQCVYGRYAPNKGRNSQTEGGILKEYRNK